MQSDAMGGCEITEDPEPGPSAEEPEDQVDPSDIPPPPTHSYSQQRFAKRNRGEVLLTRVQLIIKSYLFPSPGHFSVQFTEGGSECMWFVIAV